jgi:peptidoglycan hydrolase-like protein with peptidoglycan-binding domain
MARIRLFIAATAAIAAASGMALTATLASAAPASAATRANAATRASAAGPATASAAVFCDSTSLVPGISPLNGVPDTVRVPSVGLDTGDDNCNLEYGDDNTGVSRLQIALNDCNYFAFDASSVAVDGDYGPDTRTAVEQTQEYWGVTADGEFGPNTAKAMLWPVAGSDGSECANIVSITG